MSTLYYVMDPMCSWCWAFRPVLRAFLDQLPADIEVRLVMGGLAPDTEEPMPELQQRQIRKIWEQIAARTGTAFNFDFWARCTPRRSTYPACRAVIAAAGQGKGWEMMEAIQQAYYLEARNPSDSSTLCTLAEKLGLDPQAFAGQLESAETERALQADLALARRWGVTGFPSLVAESPAGLYRLSSGYVELDHLWRRWNELRQH